VDPPDSFRGPLFKSFEHTRATPYGGPSGRATTRAGMADLLALRYALTGREAFTVVGPGDYALPVPGRDFVLEDLAPTAIPVEWAKKGWKVAGKPLFSLLFTSPGFPQGGQWAQMFLHAAGPRLTALVSDAPARRAPAFVFRPGSQSPIPADPQDTPKS
ncbi:hypothetical protein ACWGR4_30370, partial [Embleya sp. NPDC055664]